MATNNTKNSETIWNRSFITITLSNTCNLFSQMIIVTTLPLYAKALGATATVVGFVAGAFAVTAIIFGPLATPAFDSFSKKKLFAGFITFITVLVICYSFMHSVIGIIVIRLLHGCAMGVTGPISLALVSQSLPQKKMGIGISIYSLGQALAEAVGPALAIFCISAIGHSNTFRVCFCFMIAGMLLAWSIPEPSATKRIPYKFSINRIFSTKAVPASLIACLLAGLNSLIISFLAIYGADLNVSGIGVYFTVSAGCLLATRPIYGKLADRFGYSKVIVPGLVFFAAAFLIISQSTELWMFIVAAVVASCGYGACLPLIQATAIQCAPAKNSGTASSTFFLFFNGGQFIGPFAAGAFVNFITARTGSEITGYSTMYIVAAVLVIIAIVLFLLLKRKIANNIKLAEAANEQAPEGADNV